MKKCQECGHENGDNTNFCSSCGNKLQTISTTQNINQNGDTQQQTNDFNNNQQVNDFNNNQQTNNYPVNQSQDYQQPVSQQQYNNQQTYQTHDYPARKHKNVWLAVILDVIGGIIFYFLSGIGQLYLGLYTRGIVLCVVGVLVTLVNVAILLLMNEFISNILTLIIGLALVIYSAYDAYICANAINEGRTLPLLFGVLDLQ